MKANELVKKYGLEQARRTLLIAEFTQPRNYELVNDLERIVYSHDLVASCGGIDKAKRTCSIDLERLQQAIADVESCL